MSLLQITNLSYSVGSKMLISDITIDVTTNTIVVLLGPNGAGKTTLLKCIMGLNKSPTADYTQQKNSIVFDGAIINNWPIHKRVEHGLLYLPQQSALFQTMSVDENLDIVYYYHPFWEKKQRAIFNEEKQQLLEQLHIQNTIKQQAGTLSGGQKRKLEIVRSLLMKPKLLILDEPFAGVDPKSIYELKEIIIQLKKRGISIVISDHHVDQLLSLGNLVYVLVNGKVVISGDSTMILNNAYTKEHYLGQQFYNEITQRLS